MNHDLMDLRLAERRALLAAPRARTEALVDARLGELVDYCWHDIPLYRRLWQEAGVSPADYTDRHSLVKFPRVDKTVLAEAGGDLLRYSRGQAALCTKGTTGRATTLWLDRDDYEMTLPGVIMGFLQAGMRHGMTVMLLSPAWHRMSALECAAARHIGAIPVFPSGSILDARFQDTFVEALRTHRPGFVTAMAPLILSIIKTLDAAGEDPRKLFAGVESLMVMGLPMTPGLRDYLKARTGVAQLWDRGGSTEGLASDECECHDGWHVYEDTVWCELLDAKGKPVPDGERGWLTFTKLNRSPSPVFRYDAGDLGEFIPGTCRCGNPMRRLRLVGRAETCLKLGNRTIVAWDARVLVEQDPELVGRNVLLVRDVQGWRGMTLDAKPVLHLVVEGDPVNEIDLLQRLHVGLDLGEVRVSWAGGAALQWSFRQVVDRAELPFLDKQDK